MAIDRHEINMVIYYGLARESANTVMAESPFFKPELQSMWSKFDLVGANKLLDEIGLKERDSRGMRLLKDGRPVEIIVETAGEGAEHTDVLELVRDRPKMARMGQAARALAHPNAAIRAANVLEEMVGRRPPI